MGFVGYYCRLAEHGTPWPSSHHYFSNPWYPLLYLVLLDEILGAIIMGILKHFNNYIGAICLAAVLVIIWYLAQHPFSLWLPAYSLLPRWLQDKSLVMLVTSYFYYIIIPAFLFGTVIFYFRVLKNL